MRHRPRPNLSRVWLLACLLFAAAIGLYWLSNVEVYVEDPAVVTFSRGQRLIGPVDDPWPRVAPEPELFTKPCYFSAREPVCEARFRVDIDPVIAGQRTSRLALYLPAWRGHVRIFLNDALLVDSRTYASGQTLAQNPPILRLLPEGLLKPTDNSLTIETFGFTYWGDAPGPIQIGPEQVLRAKKQEVDLLTLDLPQGIDAVSGVFGLLLIAVSFRRGTPRHMRYVGLAMVVLTFGSLPLLLPDKAFDPLIIFTNFMRMMLGPVFWMLTWRWMHPEAAPPRIRRLFFLVPVMAWLSYYIVPANHAALVCGLIPILLCFIPGTLALVEVAAWIRREPVDSALLLGSALIIAYVAVSLDVVALTTSRGQVVFSVLRYGTGLSIVIMCGILILEFLAQLHRSEGQRRALRQTVAQVSLELARVHEYEKRALGRRLIAQERNRLMADLHDGLSGQLVSIQALCEEDPPDLKDRIVAATQHALTDLELVVATFGESSASLQSVLEKVRVSITPQVQSADMRLDWDVAEIPVAFSLLPPASLNLSRLLAEAFANAIRHSRGTAIRFEARLDPRSRSAVVLSVTDDGSGGVMARERGRGIRNMHRRAADLGASLSFQSTHHGSQVQLVLPCAASSGAVVTEADARTG